MLIGFAAHCIPDHFQSITASRYNLCPQGVFYKLKIRRSEK